MWIAVDCSMQRRIVLVSIALLLAGMSCFAQESRGSITGKVLNSQAAIVPGAKVTVTNMETNVSTTVTANSGRRRDEPVERQRARG